MSDYLSGEAADSFDDHGRERSDTHTKTASPAYTPPAEWAVDDHLPAAYLSNAVVGYYKDHRLITCLHSRDLDPDTDRDRPRLRCLDCETETDDPTDLAAFRSPCPDG